MKPGRGQGGETGERGDKPGDGIRGVAGKELASWNMSQEPYRIIFLENVSLGECLTGSESSDQSRVSASLLVEGTD